MLFQVTNSRTNIIGADPFILDILDQELRYPTEFAEDNFALPSDSENRRPGWDGWVRLLRITKRIPCWFPTGLLSHAVRLCGKFGYAVSIDDQREKPKGDLPEFVAIPLRDYQREAADKAVREGRGVLDLPPRSGKTRIMCEITRLLSLPTIWIAPTSQIVTQTVNALSDWFGQNYAYQLIGSANAKFAANYRIVVCTAATAYGLKSIFFKTRECIVVDEFHHAAAPSYKQIFDQCDHVFYRYGMTGTFFRSGADVLAMHALLSKTIYKKSSLDLFRMGYLVPVYAVFIPVPTKRLMRLSSQTFHGGHGTKGIHENGIRNQLVAYTAAFLYQTGRKTLVLVGTKKQGRVLRKMLNALLPSVPESARFRACEFVSTDMDRKKQEQVLESFEGGQEVKVLLGTTILGEGVDLPTTDALVLARGEKAEVSLTQAIYRVSTAVAGKDHAVVVDFADRHHRKLKEHSLERLKTYYNEPTFTVEILDEPRSFPNWLQSRVPKFGLAALK